VKHSGRIATKKDPRMLQNPSGGILSIFFKNGSEFKKYAGNPPGLAFCNIPKSHHFK